MMRGLFLAVLSLCACGPNVGVTSSDTGSTSAADDDGDDDDEATFGGTTTSNDSTVTSVDVTSVGSQDSGATTSDSGSNPFVIEPDAGSGDWCDLWIDDCPVGEKCMPWANDGGSSWNATRCFPIADDPKEVGEPCTVVESGVSGIDDCERRSMCWNVDPDTMMGECVAFCSGSELNATCEDPCDVCPISGDGILILCLPTCDPLLQDCDEGQGCYMTHDSFLCMFDAGARMGGVGDACEFVNVCDPGLFCAASESVPDCEATGCCAPFCDALADDPCAAMPVGVECIPLYEEGEAPPCGAGVVGGCLLPS